MGAASVRTPDDQETAASIRPPTGSGSDRTRAPDAEFRPASDSGPPETAEQDVGGGHSRLASNESGDVPGQVVDGRMNLRRLPRRGCAPSGALGHCLGAPGRIGLAFPGHGGQATPTANRRRRRPAVEGPGTRGCPMRPDPRSRPLPRNIWSAARATRAAGPPVSGRAHPTARSGPRIHNTYGNGEEESGRSLGSTSPAGGR